MGYITEDQYNQLNKENSRWQRQAFENLRGKTGESDKFYTHYKLSEDESRIIFLGFMNNDGVGSSRILCSEELNKAFPQGYRIALPDRSCGFVIPNDITNQELADIQIMLKKMLRGAATPMSDELFSPDEFSLPTSWLAPIDRSHSQKIIGSIGLNIPPAKRR